MIPGVEQHGSIALVQFEFGHVPEKLNLPSGRVVVVVDGMEHAGFDYEAFKAERVAFLAQNSLGPDTEVTFVPVSTKLGDMIVQRGNHIDWYEGPTLAEALGA